MGVAVRGKAMLLKERLGLGAEAVVGVALLSAKQVVVGKDLALANIHCSEGFFHLIVFK